MLNIYRASAGSGKTYSLTQDYINLLFQPGREKPHRRILAVTFTNKATEEMKNRILKELHQLSLGQDSDYRAGLMETFRMSSSEVDAKAQRLLISILHDYSSFSISTIDRFFQQVIRAFAREIGIHGGYNLELDTTQTLEQAVDNLFQDLSKEENKQLLSWLTTYAEEKVEQSENWNIRSNILGLGKEIFEESYQSKAEDTNKKLHDREFINTYRNQLRLVKSNIEEKLKLHAEKGLKIIEENGITPESFKNGSRSAMRSLYKLRNGFDSVSATFIEMSTDVKKSYSKTTAQSTVAAIESAYSQGLQSCLQQIVEILSTESIKYNTSDLILKHINTLGILSDLTTHIKRLTSEQNTMLMSDSNILLNKIIDNSDTPFVYEKTGIHIDNFMIDEFQDTSVLQWKNFHPLISNSLASDKFNLVVGDVKQSIYRWRNSDWKLLDEQLYTDFRGEQIKDKNLGTNWRSDKNIINFNNSFFRRASLILQQRLNESLTEVLATHPELEALTTKIEHAYGNIHQEISAKAGEGRVKFQFIDSDNTDEGWATESLNRLPGIIEDLQMRGYKPADITILVRRNKEEQDIVQKLLLFKNSDQAKEGICYNLMGNEGLLIGNSASVRFILGIMQLFINPDDSISQTIVNYEYCIGKLKMSENEAINSCFQSPKASVTDLSGLFSDEENHQLKNLHHSSLFNMVEEISMIFNIGEWHNEAVFIQAFQDVVHKFTTGKTADLNSFVNWWKKSGVKQCISSPDSLESMRIMTVHKSKGLEANVVIIPFCDWKLDDSKNDILWCKPKNEPFNELPLLPVEYSKKMGQSYFADYYYDEQMHQFIDNLNVAYVAFTRAKHEMICLAPLPKEPKNLSDINTLSGLLTTCFSLSTPTLDTQITALSGYYDAEKYEFVMGEPTRGKNGDTTVGEKNDIIRIYPSNKINNRIKIKHQSLEFTADKTAIADNRLNYGLIMHDILKDIRYKEDQTAVIAQMIREGRINREESFYIENELEKFWNFNQTKEWFASDLRVLNETTILTPGGGQYRPDRVVFKNNEATIIDYKFGDKEEKSYLKQVKQYMSLIAEMGYQTKGFVCYVSLGKITPVL